MGRLGPLYLDLERCSTRWCTCSRPFRLVYTRSGGFIPHHRVRTMLVQVRVLADVERRRERCARRGAGESRRNAVATRFGAASPCGGRVDWSGASETRPAMRAAMIADTLIFGAAGGTRGTACCGCPSSRPAWMPRSRSLADPDKGTLVAEAIEVFS